MYISNLMREKIREESFVAEKTVHFYYLMNTTKNCDRFQRVALTIYSKII